MRGLVLWTSRRPQRTPGVRECGRSTRYRAPRSLRSGLTSCQISVAHPGSLGPIQVPAAASRRPMRVKIQGRPGSVSQMGSTAVNGRLCSSPRVADPRVTPLQVAFFRMFYLRVYSRWMSTGSPSETDDPGFLTDSSDAVLLKELKSIIQEHSTHRPFSSSEP